MPHLMCEPFAKSLDLRKKKFVITSAGSISKFSISVRSLRNDTISILIDF